MSRPEEGLPEAPGTDPGALRHSIRPVSMGTPEGNAALEAFLREVETRLADPKADRNHLVRDWLWQIYEGRPYDAEMVSNAALPPALRLRLAGHDPRNAALEPEFYFDCDVTRYAPRKPLLWFWTQFDRSPLGRNLHLGFRLRRLLAPHVFQSVGRNVKIFQGLEVTFGYNLEVGDDVVIHRDVLLDDRGGIRIGHRVSISDFANVYSHSHDIHDIHDIRTPMTIIGDGARITYHATVMAGVTIGADALVGSLGVATKDVPAHEVHGGVPCRFLRRKER